MNNNEQLETKVDFIYQLVLREKLAKQEDENKLKGVIRELLGRMSIAEILHMLIYPYFPAPMFDDTITTIRVPSGKLAFVSMSSDKYLEVSRSEQLYCDFATGRDALCRLFSEKHNLGWTWANGDGSSHLLRNSEDGIFSIVDFNLDEPADSITESEVIVGSLNCEKWVCLMDYEQYLALDNFSSRESEVIVYETQPGVYEYIAMGLKDDKDFCPGLFIDGRVNVSTLEWISPL